MPKNLLLPLLFLTLNLFAGTARKSIFERVARSYAGKLTF